MVLFDDRLVLHLADFGIQIPILDTRCTRTLSTLAAHPRLADRRWLTGLTEPEITREDLERVHDPAYIARLFGPELTHEIETAFELIVDGRLNRYQPETARRPLAGLFDWIKLQAAGTVQAGRMALANGFTFFLGGGMHHAMPARGSGFCLVNDIVVALRKLRAEGAAQRFWVIDVDAHKGDGTAVLCHGDSQTATLSIHMGAAWPLDEPAWDDQFNLKLPFWPSTIDIPLYEGEEDTYLPRLRQGLAELEAETFRPDLVFVVDGADPYEHDELPSTRTMKLTLDQLLERDLFLHDWFRHRHIPAAFLMAGGYGSRVWEVYHNFLQTLLLRESHA